MTKSDLSFAVLLFRFSVGIFQSVPRIILRWFLYVHRCEEERIVLLPFLFHDMWRPRANKRLSGSNREAWPYNRVFEVFAYMWLYTEGGLLI